MTLLAARHIHINSKQVERLGIHARSTVMKLYVIFWISLALCTLGATTLTIMDSKAQNQEEYGDHRERLIIAASTFIGLLYVLTSSFDLIMLYAYYRMSENFSDKA